MMAGVADSGARALKVLILVIACFGGSLLAAPDDYEGHPVGEILFDPALQPIPDNELREILPLRVGEPLELGRLRDGLARLYSTGRYQDVSVDAELVDGRVTLRFLTRTTWFVGRVAVEGAPDPPNRGQLINSTRLQLGREFTEESSEAALTNILAVLHENGLREARVERFLDYEPAFAQVNVLFLVTPGKRARFAKPTVVGVSAEEADRVISAAHWERFWLLPGWKPVTSRRVQNGMERIRRFYQKQGYLLNSVTLSGMEYLPASNRLTPKIEVQRGLPVEVTAEGADIGGRRLRQLIPVFQEQSVDRDLLLEGARNLTEHFQAQGYFDTTVAFTERGDEDKEIIEYLIQTGERHKLVGLEVAGNWYFDRQTILERLSITPATWPRYRNGRYSQLMLETDLERVRNLYRSNGFRDVEVTSEIQPLSADSRRDEVVTIRVSEGPQWFVSGLELKGVSAANEPNVRSRVGSGPGQPFSEANLFTDRDTVLDYYYNNGYPNAALSWSVEELADTERVNLVLSIQEGVRQFVRASLIGGLETTDPELVYSRIHLQPGAPISQSEIVESQRRLYDLGIFARVDTAIQNPDGFGDRKYILHQFEEARQWSVNVGLGAQIARIGSGVPDFDNPAGSTGFSPRISFGVARSNMFGAAHMASMQSQVSDTRQRGLINYIAPQFKGRENLSLSVSGVYDFSRDINTFESTRWEGSLNFSQQLSRANTVQYRFVYRRVKTDNLAISPDLVPIFAQSARVGLVAGGFIQDRRDDPLDSTRGYYNAIEVGLASKIFASETDYFRLVGRNSTYHRLHGDLVLARSLTVGWLRNTANQTEKPIPLPELFYSGGASSHRGFPDNQAGPRDQETGFVIGGRAVLMHNLELRFPLIGDNLGGVLFHDVGNVFSDMESLAFRFRQRDRTDQNYMVHSFGFGIRYRTPVGPVRLDLAYSPNSTRFFGFQGTREDLIAGGGEQTDRRISPFQFFFSIGQTF